jgi:hypothetical protein
VDLGPFELAGVEVLAGGIAALERVASGAVLSIVANEPTEARTDSGARSLGDQDRGGEKLGAAGEVHAAPFGCS